MMTHTPDHTNRVVIIIGLIFEGIGVFFSTIFTVMFLTIDQWFTYRDSLEMPYPDYVNIIEVFQTIGMILIFITALISIIFLINLTLFRRLLRGDYTEEKARKVYLYQAIYGGLNLLSNQILGIMYLVAGIRGYNGQKEETDIRDGI